MIELDADVDDYEVSATGAADMEFFDAAEPPEGVSLMIRHQVQWGRSPNSADYDFHYNFLDYRFEKGDSVLLGRTYKDEADRVSLRGPTQRDGSAIRDEALVEIAVRYFSDREFADIQMLGPEGYAPVDPSLYAGQG